MCGIVVVFRRGGGDPKPELERALHLIAHRGPDDSGIWTGKGNGVGGPFTLGLGNVRLSILDLSPEGHQPMVGSEGFVITFNGEIYNYRELREELKTLGHAFRTSCDTEVILAAYRQWGPACVERFIGMWALGIWDGERLFMSRDRLGQKPLYIFRDEQEGILAFASEIQALLCLEGVPRRPNQRTVYRYLAFSEMETGESTFFESIRELPPATNLFFNPKDGSVRRERYWELPNQEEEVEESQAVKTTESLLFESVRLRLRSDAPLGISLSGGLDSTLLLSLANEAGERELPVFSTGYSHRGYDETSYLEAAIAGLSCRPHWAASDAAAFVRDFEKLVKYLGQPSRLPGPFSQWMVAQRASGQVKVLLDGQGADELAGGYLYFLPAAWRESSLLDKVLRAPDLTRTILQNRHLLSQYPLALVVERIRGKRTVHQRLPLNRDWEDSFREELPRWSHANGSFNEVLRAALTETSLPALLRYGDRLTMAFGIENRSPYLDHRLVAYVSSLPSRFKIRGGTTKWVFREVARGRIPPRVLKRRMKMGFPTPFGAWMRRDIVDDARLWLDGYFALPSYRDWIDPAEVARLVDEQQKGIQDHQALLWRLLCLGAWAKIAQAA